MTSSPYREPGIPYDVRRSNRARYARIEVDAGGVRVIVPRQMPLDEVERYSSLPYGVAIAPDKSRIYVSASGSDEVAVISVPKLLGMARSPEHASYANDLSAFEEVLVEAGLRRDDTLKFISEAEHLHSTDDVYRDQFEELQYRLGIDV